MDHSIKGGVTERDSKNIQYESSSKVLPEKHEDKNVDHSNESTDEAVRQVCIELRPFFRKIEGLPVHEMQKKLQSLNMRTTGNRDILLRRLKKYYERKKLAQCNLLQEKKYCPYYVVIDFEATCIEVNPPDYPHEIIEFPAVLISSKTKTVVDVFQEYVRPVINPRLSKFCTKLTGITQDLVDAAEPFPVVLDRFKTWLLSHGLNNKKWYKVVTDGPWDMAQFLHGQCVLSGIPYPKFAESWINLRKVFGRYYKSKTCSLKAMLGVLGLSFEGRPHCGVDDATNIAQVLLNLIDDFAILEVNEKLDLRNQKYRERALLRAAIKTLESRKDSSDEDTLQRLKDALALRMRRKRVSTVGFDEHEEKFSSGEEDENGPKAERAKLNLRPKVVNVKEPLSEEGEEESTDIKTPDGGLDKEYCEFSSQNKFSLLSGLS